jgi:hypothetical protein
MKYSIAKQGHKGLAYRTIYQLEFGQKLEKELNSMRIEANQMLASAGSEYSNYISRTMQLVSIKRKRLLRGGAVLLWLLKITRQQEEIE